MFLYVFQFCRQQESTLYHKSSGHQSIAFTILSLSFSTNLSRNLLNALTDFIHGNPIQLLELFQSQMFLTKFRLYHSLSRSSIIRVCTCVNGPPSHLADLTSMKSRKQSTSHGHPTRLCCLYFDETGPSAAE